MDFIIPPDTETFAGILEAKPALWHWPLERQEKVYRIATGRKVRAAVGDTGYTKHIDGPEPVEQKSFISGQTTRDGHGHGTHCAGILLGRNGIGVAKDADLMVFKCLSNEGSGPSPSISAGIRWAANAGADIISLSLGGGSSDAETNAAIDYAFAQGCLVNCAAGNSGYNGNNTIGWPGRHEGAICCGSYAENGSISSFSSGGREIDWACPGSNIYSFSPNGSGYVKMSGTSMATPFGSGVLALIIEVMRRIGDKHWTSVEAVKEFFKLNLKDAGAPGWDPRFGQGIPVAEDILNSLMKNALEFA